MKIFRASGPRESFFIKQNHLKTETRKKFHFDEKDASGPASKDEKKS